MELQPRMHGITHAQGKSGIPEGRLGILHGETNHEFILSQPIRFHE